MNQPTELQRAIHYLKVLQSNYRFMQEEIRDSIDFSIKILSRVDLMQRTADNMINDLKELSKE